MGSEGYLINQFLAARVNKRTDEWGGSFENRMRLPVQILKACRANVDPKFILIFRLSMLDLVEEGSDWSEVVALAQVIFFYKRFSPGDFPRHPKTGDPDNKRTVTKHAKYSIRGHSGFINLHM